MKRKTTKEILAESFRELAQNKNVEKIIIKDITDNCEMSPATFYRHFRDKYELMAWDYVNSCSKILDQIGTDGYQWKDSLTDGIRYYYNIRGYLKNLLMNTKGQTAFVAAMAGANVEFMKNEIRKATGKEEIDEDIDKYVKIYCYGTVQLICEWITGGFSMKPEELAVICENATPVPLEAYLK